jgi:DNA-binding LytR/AlgR family response regulator
MIRVLIVDDEAPARSRLGRMLTSFSDLAVVGEASNGIEALQLVETSKPDLIFLDIEMPELSGLEVAETLVGHGPIIVFVTAYSEHALKAFELSAMDYLVKPVSPERLSETIERIRKGKGAASLGQFQELMTRMEEGRAKKRMAVKCGTKYKVFDLASISAVVAKDHYAVLLVNGQELTADDSVDALAKRLDSQRFLRIHRSAIINLDYLKELEHEGDRKYAAVLDDSAKTRLPVSRERLDDLKKVLNLD